MFFFFVWTFSWGINFSLSNDHLTAKWWTIFLIAYHSFMCEKKISFRKKDGENFAKANPGAHLKINLTSLQHDFLHLNDMWRKILFSFWLLLEKENSREKRGRNACTAKTKKVQMSHQSHQQKWCPSSDSWLLGSIWWRRLIRDQQPSRSLQIARDSSLFHQVGQLQR